MFNDLRTPATAHAHPSTSAAQKEREDASFVGKLFGGIFWFPLAPHQRDICIIEHKRARAETDISNVARSNPPLHRSTRHTDLCRSFVDGD
jgi:hypothetical protein